MVAGPGTGAVVGCGHLGRASARAGGGVTIPKGRTVLLDVSPPPLARLHVEGTLLFADKDLALQAQAIDVPGRLRSAARRGPSATGPS